MLPCQVDHSAWMDPQLSHHESRLKPGDGLGNLAIPELHFCYRDNGEQP